MNKQSYPNYYELKVKRKAILEYYGHKCYLCNNEATQVHHIDENRGNHNVYNLVPLCHKCHRMVHKKENKNKNYFSNFKAPNALNIPKIKGKDNDEDKYKISLHFRASDVWIQMATARAEKLGLSLSEYIRSVVTKDVEEGRKLDQKYIWVLESPDNEHWDEKFAREEIARISQKWNVQVAPTSETRDQGHGLERVFIVQGKEEDINEFESELNEALY